MTIKLTSDEIVNRYPELFGTAPFDPMETLICFGLEVGEGWLKILDETFKKISDIVKKRNLEEFRIIQVKEKYAGLRIYCSWCEEDIEEIIAEAEKICEKTCEQCGSPEGIFSNDGWCIVQCQKCRDEAK